jgi:FKBP-type peptidyl-prolyl cis-trans isomerase (trigger factor)
VKPINSMSSQSFRLTLKSVNPSVKLPGFRDGSLTIQNVQLGDTIAQHLYNLNNFRSPDSQINKLYNRLGEEIDQSLWKMKINDNLTLYIDRR